jgi:alkaline phosphatase D
MAVIMRHAASLSRRRFLGTAAATLAAGGLARPYLSRAADRPCITHGIACGDVSHDAAVVWARSDRPARMLVEIAPTERFTTITAAHVVDALPATDFTAKALIQGLPGGQDLFYRVRFADYAAPTIVGEAQVGRFRTAPETSRSVSFVWSGDAAGQGWGIDESRGGMRTFATMLGNRPDFFIHSGDSIYADCPIPTEQRLPGGLIWRNIVTEEKSKVAETLDEFRGNYKYNLLDRNVRAFNAEVPIFAQWDDHEVTDDWCPNEGVPSSAYRERSIAALAARANQAFHEFMPMRETPVEAGRIYRKIFYGPMLDIFMLDMRSYRTANRRPDEARILGPVQLAWLQRELSRSRATWKIIAADLPVGLISYDAVAQGDGPPIGREVEIAELLSSSTTAASAIRFGSPPTCITPPRTTTIRTPRCTRTSIRSGNSSPARCTPAPGRPARSTTRSAPARSSPRVAAASKATTSRPASDCSSLAMWRSTARAR